MLRVNSRVWRGLTFSLRAAVSSMEFSRKFEGKEYKDILGLSGDDEADSKGLYRAYMSQIKRYHADSAQLESDKKEREEICKIIIAAYRELKRESEEREGKWENGGAFEDENEVAMELFSKPYNSIKHTLYLSGNEKMRADFVEALQQRKKTREDLRSQARPKPSPASGASSGQFRQPPEEKSNPVTLGLMGVGVLCLLGLLPLLQGGSDKKRVASSKELAKDNKVRDYTEEEIDLVIKNMGLMATKSIERFYNWIDKRRPHMRLMKAGSDPDIFTQLTDYSIAQDIHLYEVSGELFMKEAAQQEVVERNSAEGLEMHELTEAKPNTVLTLSLEAERCLHNIFVKVDDVLAEIREKGKYTPPKVFFRFHGHMMVEIRDKPFSSLQSYYNTKYISLFDLYFNYYSPIFFKRDSFTDYLTGKHEIVDKNHRYYGQVHLNHRRVPVKFITKDQKVVFMKDPKGCYESGGKLLKEADKKYLADWTDYYRLNERNWKKYCPHQAEGKTKYFDKEEPV